MGKETAATKRNGSLISGDLRDHEWLTSVAAEEWLTWIQGQAVTPALLSRLRKALPAERVILVVTQSQLRDRARHKFADADRLFFDTQGLQQATDDVIAQYKSSVLGKGHSIIDLCCGIGGDAMNLAVRHHVTAIDRDPIRVHFARANLERRGLHGLIVREEAQPSQLLDCDGWHIDPDRRSGGKRTTRMDRMNPTQEFIGQALEINKHAIIKLAPATPVPLPWRDHCEREWIGHSRECQQQLLRFGRFASQPGKRKATVLSTDPRQAPCQIVEGTDSVPEAAKELMPYLVEPHAAVIAAGLADDLAARSQWYRLTSGIPYYTTHHPLMSPLACAFSIAVSMPFDVRRLRRWMREQNGHIVGIKLRGVSIDPQVVSRQLRSGGDRDWTLFLFPWRGTVTAVVAERLRHETNA